MRKIVAIGEALIDFIPDQKNVSLEHVQKFMKTPGGAPANVCACAAKLGANSYFMGMVGDDGFGQYLISTLKEVGVNTTKIKQTKKAPTALSFVSLKDHGERDFIFYRNPSADQLMTAEDLDYSVLDESILHFCSISLDDYPIKNAHLKAIEYVKTHRGIVSFDPNIRLALWSDHEAYRQVIRDFIHYSDLIKISDDELEFITGFSKEEDAIRYLKKYDIKYIIITKGSLGVTLYTKKHKYHAPGYKVNSIDTTGAGDAWIGTFLYMLSMNEVTHENEDKMLPIYLNYANVSAALTTTKFGAISALPNRKEIDDFIESHRSI